jgi:hypothetical protein
LELALAILVQQYSVQDADYVGAAGTQFVTIAGMPGALMHRRKKE